MSPDAYKEMLEVIAADIRKSNFQDLEKADALSIQIDGSDDKWQHPKKFVCLQSVSNGELKSVFLAVVEAESHGAVGLLEATEMGFRAVNYDIEQAMNSKVFAVTTDGESTNGYW